MQKSRPLLKPLLMVAGATLVVLILNVVAMRFTPEVSWGPGDFLVAGVLLFGAGSSVVVACSVLTSRAQRIWATVAIAVGLALVWAELAVGLFH